MPLLLMPALRADSGRIAEIHMAAFGSNAMLRAQFPMPALHKALQNTIRLKALADIDDPKTTVLVVRETPGQRAHQGQNESESGKKSEDRGTVIAFAKWAHPVLEGEDYFEPPLLWPEGTNLEVLGGWTEKTEEAQERALGRTPCYKLTFMGTDPLHERRGAASLMLRWGIEQCQLHNTPAYLESTLEAVGFYKKYGFTPVETFSLDIPGVGNGVYRETSFTFFPKGGTV